jgi:tetratricopeptide (TPR) repeat protein
LPEAEDACRKAIAACQEEAGKRYDIQAQYDLGLTYDLLGKILADRRKSAEAETAFRDAAAAQVQAIRMKPTADQAPDIRRALARARHHLGKTLLALGKYAEAEAACHDALPDLPQNEAADTHFLLGLVLEQQGHLGQAEAVFRRVIDGSLRPAEGGDTDRKHDLGHAYRVLARVLHHQGKNNEAEAAVNKAIAVLTPLTRGKTETPGPGCELAGAYGFLGKLRQDLGRLPQAHEAHRQAVALAEKLVKDFPGEQSQQALAGALNDLGGLQPEEPHPDAEAALRRARNLWRGLWEKHPQDADYREGLAMASSNLVGVLLQKGGYAEAEPLLDEAVRLRRELSRDGHSSDARLWLAGDLARQARLLMANGRRADAERAHDQAEGLLRPLVQQFPAMPIYKRALAQSHFNRGRLLEDTGSAGAEGAFRQARDLFEELAGKYPDEPDYTRELASSLNSLGRARMRADSADAERTLRRALKLWETLVEKYPGVPDYRKHLAVCCSNLSLLLERNPRRVAEAHDFTMRAFGLFEKLADDHPGVPQYQSDLAGVLHNVAFVLRAQGRLPEARAHMERAIKKQQAALDAVGGRHTRYRKQLWTHYWGLAEVLIALEDHAGASRAVENMPRIDGGWEACYRAVPLLARCAVLAGKDDKLPPAERQRLYRSHVGHLKELLAEALKRIAAAKPQTPEQRQKLAEGAISVGDAFGDVREVDRARQSYETAVELCPRLAVAHYRMGGILYYQRALPEAVAAFRQAITLRPEYAEAHEGLAMALAGQGQDKVEDAVTAYRKAGELYTDRTQAARLYVNLGTLLAKSRRLPEAEGAFRKAVKLQPKSVEAHYSLGLALGQQGKRKEAIAAWRKAVEVKPDYAPAWGNLGFALHKDGQTGEALKALREARKLLSADDPARPRIEALIHELERLSEPGKG